LNPFNILKESARYVLGSLLGRRPPIALFSVATFDQSPDSTNPKRQMINKYLATFPKLPLARFVIKRMSPISGMNVVKLFLA
jgi:hypothetical protein